MERLLTVGEVAAWLQVKPRTIYQWVHEGYIPVVKLGTLVLFKPASLSQWLTEREMSGRGKIRLDVAP